MNKYLIIEKSFIQKLYEGNSESQQDFLKFLQLEFKQYHLICDVIDENEFTVLMTEIPLWRIFADNNLSIEFLSHCDLTEINSSKLINNGIFLINDTNETAGLYELEKVVIKPSTLDSVWSKISSLFRPISLKVTQSNLIESEYKIENWGQLNTWINPIRDIIIFDKHILYDSTDQKLCDNLLPLLEMLLINNKKQIGKSHITILTEFVDKMAKTDIERNDHSQLMKKYYEIIKKHLESKGIKNFHLNIIKHLKIKYPRQTIKGELFQGFHGRYLLSNYFLIRSDDCFNFFKSNKKVNTDANITIGCNLGKPCSNNYLKDIIDIKSYIDSLKNEESGFEPYKTFFYPDKVNPLIDSIKIS